MLDARQRRMTPDEFYAWQETVEEKYELVDGIAVRRGGAVELMTGASRRHDRIVWNLILAIGKQLAGKPCTGFTSDTAVRTPVNRLRRPDVGIECGARDDGSTEAEDVRFVAEVLSPLTFEYDMFVKLDENRAIASMRHIVLVEPNAPLALVWTRADEGDWTSFRVEGIEGQIDLPAVELTLAMHEIYGDLSFRPRPRLVPDDGA